MLYAGRLLDRLLASGCKVHLSISPAAQIVMEEELTLNIDLENFIPEMLLDEVRQRWLPSDSSSSNQAASEAIENSITHDGQLCGEIVYHNYRDFRSPIASGSFPTKAMVVCPCSGSTLSAIAHASAGNLIQRAAEVHLKERRKLVLVPRETPLSTLQLENMLRVSQAGAVVLPAAPGFYHGATRVEDLVDFVVSRICDQLELDNSLIHRWGT